MDDKSSLGAEAIPTLAALVCGVTVVAFAGGCGGQSPSVPSTADPLEVAYSQARGEPNLKSLVVSRDHSTVRAEYFNGGGPDTAEPVFSVTKSVLALAIGAALDAGCLSSLDQTLGELLGPALVTDPSKSGITLRHLLTMSSGIDFPEALSYTSATTLFSLWTSAPDQVEFVMARPMTATPGTRFEYGSGTIHLASVALSRACGTSTSAFTLERLFATLDIPARAWQTDRQGFNNGGSGLSLAPGDMQAIGRLVLDGGQFEGRRVVSAAWVGEMTRPQIATAPGPGTATPSYGYGWWVGRTPAGNPFCLAHGWAGQFIFVVPAKRLVVTAASSNSGVSGQAAMSQWQRTHDIIYSQIVPAF